MTTDKKHYWTQQLAESRRKLEQLINPLSEVQWQTPVFSEGDTWTVLDIVAHIVENERGMSIQVHKIRQGRETVPEGFDLDGWNAGLKARMAQATPAELRQSLPQTRAKTLEVLDSLRDEEWSLQGRHPSRGIITIEQYYETMVYHEIGHGEDIRQALGLEQ